MAYSGTYTISDTPDIVGDLTGTIMVAIVENAPDLVDMAIAGGFVALALGIVYGVRKFIKVGKLLGLGN